MSSYRVAPGVRWQVGSTGVTVSDGSGGVRSLGHPEGAVWDLVSRGYHLDRVASLVGWIAGVDQPRARALVHDALESWRAAGLVERS